MLLSWNDCYAVRSFAQLYWSTTQEILMPHRRNPKRATVLGPITHSDPAIVKKNLDVLANQARRLSDAGWMVLDLTSYRSVIDRILRERAVSGYPFTILEDFTLPLIKNGWFSVLWFRYPFSHSVGAMREYAEAQAYDIEVRHFS